MHATCTFRRPPAPDRAQDAVSDDYHDATFNQASAPSLGHGSCPEERRIGMRHRLTRNFRGELERGVDRKGAMDGLGWSGGELETMEGQRQRDVGQTHRQRALHPCRKTRSTPRQDTGLLRHQTRGSGGGAQGMGSSLMKDTGSWSVHVHRTTLAT